MPWLFAISPLTACTPSPKASNYGRLSAAPSLTASFRPPASRRWHRYTSKSIELVTDYPRDQALEAVRVFERAQVFLNQVLPYKAPRPGSPLLVVLFQDPSEIRSRTNNPMAVCTFMVQAPGALHRRPMILAAGDNTQSMRLHWVHELTHYELYRRYGALPAWLDEGLASYYSSIDDRGDRVLLGTPQRLWRFVDDDRGMRTKKEWTHNRTEVPKTWFLDASDLVRTNYRQFHPSMSSQKPSQRDMENEVVNYAESWLVAHMLFHGQPSYRQLLQASIHQQPDPLKWGQDLNNRLKALPRHTLDRDLASYTRRIATPARAIPMPHYLPSQIRIEALSAAQTVEVQATGLAKPEEMLPELEAAMARAIPSSQALRSRAWMRLRLNQISQAARDLCAAHELARDPGSSTDAHEMAEILHLGLWIDVELRRRGKALGCLPGADTHGTAWAEALTQKAHSAAQWHAATQIFGAYRQYARAYQTGQRALRSDRSCWACYESLAQLSFRLGHPKQAVALQHNAIEWTPDALGPRYQDRQRSALTRYIQSKPRTNTP